MGTIVTKDVLQNFITNYYGKTDISSIGDGKVTGAISEIYETLLPTVVTITLASEFTSFEGYCYKMGHLVIASFSITAKDKAVGISNGKVIASGFPIPWQNPRLDGQVWTNGGSSCPLIRCTILDNGNLAGYFADSSVEIIDPSRPVMFNFVYATGTRIM